MVTLTCLGDTSGGVGNKRASTSSWWSCRALALGMFSWKMEPSWNCVNGQKTEKLQRMVFYDQACLIFVKNRVVKVSTSHHPRYAVCISPLPCFGRSASLALLHLLRLTSALLHPSNEEQESWCIPPHVCRGSGIWAPSSALRCLKNLFFIPTLGVCNMFWHCFTKVKRWFVCQVWKLCAKCNGSTGKCF